MRKKRKNERGVALVMTLGLMSVLVVLIAASTATSQTLRFTIATSTQLNDSIYYSESAMNRAVWLLINDRTIFPDRTIKPDNEQLIQRERFRADSSPHIIESGGIPVVVKIYDMNSGVNISGFNLSASFSYLHRGLKRKGLPIDSLDHFKNRLQDYIDSDDLLRSGGLEKSDYESFGLTPLPRNAQMQFREEILWIPGSEAFLSANEHGFLNDINLIPPRGFHFSTGKPNFYTVSSGLIQDMCDFTDRELETVLKCREKILSGKVTPEESFQHAPQLLESVKKQFSFLESNYYTLEIRPADQENGFPRRTLMVSLSVNTSIPEQGINFYQWRIF